jgi:hypothetical protein
VVWARVGSKVIVVLSTVLVVGPKLEFDGTGLELGNEVLEERVMVTAFEEVTVERELEGIAYRYTPMIMDAVMIGITATATSLLPFDNSGFPSKRKPRSYIILEYSRSVLL